MSDSIPLKLRTWWRRDELDEQLAHGADPTTDASLARRAAQLTSPTTRVHLAQALEIALREARKSWSVSARLPLRRVEVRECADDLLTLARRLRDFQPIDIAGAAMVSRLVFDGTSPLYREGPLTLRYAVRSARLALDPLEVDAVDLWTAA
ncbi:MAG TPA: hypothetical protein VF257_10630 [Solirubrobacteraceae bacterium]